MGVAMAGTSLATTEAEHRSTYLVLSCTSSLGKCRFQSFAHFSIGLFAVFFFFSSFKSLSWGWCTGPQSHFQKFPEAREQRQGLHGHGQFSKVLYKS